MLTFRYHDFKYQSLKQQTKNGAAESDFETEDENQTKLKCSLNTNPILNGSRHPRKFVLRMNIFVPREKNSLLSGSFRGSLEGASFSICAAIIKSLGSEEKAVK